MYVILGVIFIITGLLLIWFHIPWSPMKQEFEGDVETLLQEDRLPSEGELFTEEDFAQMPLPIQRYIAHCGYIGTPKMSCLHMEYRDVDFMQSKSGPALTIAYSQYNFVQEPARMAFIDSSMFGIPFEGYDYYRDGAGGMRGVIGKVIPLFHETGAEMDQACLATYLAESLFAPAILLREDISLEEISDYEVRATMTYGGSTVSGIFTFNTEYEMISFTTNDRAQVGSDGTVTYVPWTARCDGYETDSDGILHPTRFQAIWNEPEGDFVYFDGEISRVVYE